MGILLNTLLGSSTILPSSPYLFHTSCNYGIPSNHVSPFLLNALQASHILPYFAYMWIRVLPTYKSNSQPLCMICDGCNLPSSSACKTTHALSTLKKVNSSGNMPSCWKSSIVFSYWWDLAYLARLHSLENCLLIQSLVPLLPDLLPSREFHLPFSQSACSILLCLIPGYLAFVSLK